MLDEYPDATPTNVNTTDAAPYTNFSPFGFNGRLLYARVAHLW